MMDLPKNRLRHLLAVAIRDLWKKETGSLTSMSIEGTICITSHGNSTTIIQISNQFVGSIPDGSEDFCDYTQSTYITSTSTPTYVGGGSSSTPPVAMPRPERQQSPVDVEAPHVSCIADLSVSSEPKPALQFNSPSGICIDNVLCMPKNKSKRRTKVCPQKIDACSLQTSINPSGYQSLPEAVAVAKAANDNIQQQAKLITDANNNSIDATTAGANFNDKPDSDDEHIMVIDEQCEDDENNNNNEQENLNLTTNAYKDNKSDRQSPDLALSTPQSYTNQVQNVIKVPVKDVLRQRLISTAEENKNSSNAVQSYVPPMTIIGPALGTWNRQNPMAVPASMPPATSPTNPPSFVNSVIAQRQAIGDYATALIQNSTQKERAFSVTKKTFVNKSSQPKRRKLSNCNTPGQPINMTISTFENTTEGINLTQDRMYKCEFCVKTFMFKSKYNEHLPVHTDARPFQCDRCSRTYKYKYDLRVHLRTHLGIPTKSTQCPFCGGVFKSNKLLRCHIRLQHKHCDLDMAEIGGFGSEVKSDASFNKVLPTYEQAKKTVTTTTTTTSETKMEFEQSCFPEVSDYTEVKSEIITVKNEDKSMSIPLRIEQSCFPEVSKIVEAPSLIKQCKPTELSVSH